MGKIRSTSFSRLLDYESCPYKAYLKIVEKIPEPERPLPPGKTEHANDRGSRIHDEAEKFVNGTRGEPPLEVMQYFKDEFLSLRNHYKKGAVSLEGEWGFDKDWQPCDWRNAWLRVKLDANVMLDKTHSVVIDYKTSLAPRPSLPTGASSTICTAGWSVCTARRTVQTSSSTAPLSA